MLSRPELITSEWRVFLDGVEIPHQGLNLSNALDGIAAAQIFVEPDPAWQELRPDAIVHVFHRDPFPEDAAEIEDQDALLLVFEGVVTGYSFEKSADARYARIQVQSLLSYLERFRAFSMGVGYLPFSDILSGSNLLSLPGQGGASVQQQILDFQIMAKSFGEEEGEDDPINFAQRLIRLIVYLSTFNASARNIIVRSRILDRLVGINDSLIPDLFNLNLLQQLVQHSSSQITEGSTYLDIIRHVASYGFYHMTQVMFPFQPKNQAVEGSHLNLPEKTEVGAIEKQGIRNDFLFIPETFYALPPPCNIIFPDTIQSINIDRQFLAEPTRHVLEVPHLRFFVVQPELSQTAPNSKDAMGISTREEAEEAGPFTSSQGHNLLTSLNVTEIEKGLVPSYGSNPYEILAGLAFTQQEPAEGPVNDSESVRQQALQSTDDSGFTDLLQLIAKYQLTLLKYQRTGSATLVGNHSLVVGFPALFTDRNMSYIGVVTSVTYSITPQGQEITTVEFDRLRALAPIRPLISQVDIATGFIGVLDAGVNLDQTLTALDESATDDLVDFSPINQSIEQVVSQLDRLISAADELVIDAETALASTEVGIGVETEAQVVSIMRDRLDNQAFQVARVAQDLSNATLKFVQDISLLSSSDLETETLLLYALMSTSATSNSESAGVLQRALGTIRLAAPSLFGTKSVEDFGGPVITENPAFSDVGLRSSDPTTAVLLLSQLLLPMREGQPFPANLEGSFYLPTGDNLVAAARASQALVRRFEAEIFEVIKTVKPLLEEDPQDLIEQQKQAAIDAYDNTVDKIFRDLEDKFDFPAPPPFFSDELLNLESLDIYYQNTLGCRPFYAGDSPYAAPDIVAGSSLAAFQDLIGKEGLFRTDSSQAKAARLQLVAESYVQYLRGLKSIGALFPFLELVDEGDFGDNTPTSWVDVTRSEQGQTGSYEWGYTTINRRQGTTLREFLEDNNLDLTDETASGLYPGASPITFFKMDPVPTDADGNPLEEASSDVWDDSIFSKIVLTGHGSNSQEALIEARKFFDASGSEDLRTYSRRELPLQYSRRHFGSRAFDGS